MIPRARYIEYITKLFEKERFTALHSINMGIDTGDKVAFLGTNGVKKTTLLKLIGGHPSSGKITVNKYDTVLENLKA